MEKVTGAGAVYGDVLIPGMLNGVVVRSAVSHACICLLGTDQTAHMSRVVAILTAADLCTAPTGIPCATAGVAAIDRSASRDEPMTTVAGNRPPPWGVGLVDVDCASLPVKVTKLPLVRDAGTGGAGDA